MQPIEASIFLFRHPETQREGRAFRHRLHDEHRGPHAELVAGIQRADDAVVPVHHHAARRKRFHDDRAFAPAARTNQRVIRKDLRVRDLQMLVAATADGELARLYDDFAELPGARD